MAAARASSPSMLESTASKGEDAHSERTGSASMTVAQDEGPGGRKMEQIEHGVFGVLYTLSKERKDSGKVMAALKSIVEFAQLLAFIMSRDYPWDIDFDLWSFKYLTWFQTRTILQMQGYTVYIAVVYILEAILIVCLVICGYVVAGFNRSSFRWLWPIKVLKVCVGVFFSTFYVTSMDVFVGLMDCSYSSQTGTGGSSTEASAMHSPSPPVDEALQGLPAASSLTSVKELRLELYPQHLCFAMPHVVHMAVAAVALLVFSAVTLVINLGRVDLIPVDAGLDRQRNARVVLWAFALKNFLPIVTAVLSGYQKPQAVLVLAMCAYLCYLTVKWSPFHAYWSNVVQSGYYGALTWCAACLCLLTFGHESSHIMGVGMRTLATYLALIGILPAGLVAGGLAALVLRRYKHVWLKFLESTHEHSRRKTKPTIRDLQDLHKFREPHDVELAAQHWINYYDELDGLKDIRVINTVERIFMLGIHSFPQSAALRLARATFMRHGKQAAMSSVRDVTAAQKLKPNFSQRFCIFTIQQLQRQAAHQESSGEQVSDMLSYVEFRRNFNMVLATHKQVLHTENRFWRMLLKSRVEFSKLSRTFSKIDLQRMRANEMYSSLLRQYPNSLQVMRGYAHFLTTVMNNRTKAARMLELAEEVEATQAEARQRLLSQKSARGTAGADSEEASVVVTASGCIKTMSKKLCKLLGYHSTELTGLNINTLVPPPYSSVHQELLEGYTDNYEGDGYQFERPLFALHKKGYMLKITAKIVDLESTTEEDVSFMAILKPAPDDNRDGISANVVLDIQGTILAVCQGMIYSKIGKVSDVVGRPIWELACDVEDMRKTFLREMDLCTGVDRQSLDASVKPFRLTFQNMIGQMMIMNATLRMRKILGSDVFYELKMKQVEISSLLMVVKFGGIILFVADRVANLLGYEVQDLVKQNITKVMPDGMSVLHGKAWITQAETAGASLPACLSNQVVRLRAKNGGPIFCRLSVTGTATADKRQWSLELEVATAEEYKMQFCTTLSIEDGSLDVIPDESTCFGAVMDVKSLWNTCDLMSNASNPDAALELLCAVLEQNPPRPALVSVFPAESRGSTLTRSSAISRLRSSVWQKTARLHSMASLMVPRFAGDDVLVDFWAVAKMRGFLTVDDEMCITQACPQALLLLGLQNENQAVSVPLNTLVQGVPKTFSTMMRKAKLSSEASARAIGQALLGTVQTLTLPMGIVLTPLKVSGSSSLRIQLQADPTAFSTLRETEEVLHALVPHLSPATIDRLEASGFADLREHASQSDVRQLSQDSLPAVSHRPRRESVAVQMAPSSAVDAPPSEAQQLAAERPTETESAPAEQTQPPDTADSHISFEGALIGRDANFRTILPPIKFSDDASFVTPVKPPMEALVPESLLPGENLQKRVSQEPFTFPRLGRDGNESMRLSRTNTVLRGSSLAPSIPAEERISTWLSGGKSLEAAAVAAIADEESSSGHNGLEEQPMPEKESERMLELAKGLSDAHALENEKPQGTGRCQLDALLLKFKVLHATERMVHYAIVAAAITVFVLLGCYTAFVMLVSVASRDVRVLERFKRLLVAEGRTMSAISLVVWRAYTMYTYGNSHMEELDVQEAAAKAATAVAATTDITETSTSADGARAFAVDANLTAPPPSAYELHVQLLYEMLQNCTECQEQAVIALDQAQTFRTNLLKVLAMGKGEVLLHSHIYEDMTRAQIYLLPQSEEQARLEGIIPASMLDVLYDNTSTWQTMRSTLYSAVDAGNTLAAFSKRIARDYVAMQLNDSLEKSFEYQVISYTGTVLLPNAYVSTMEGYISDTKRNAKTVYDLSMTITGMELACCLISAIVITIKQWTFFMRRMRLLSIFLHIPRAVVRTFANKKVTAETLGEETQAQKAAETQLSESSSKSSSSSSEAAFKHGDKDEVFVTPGDYTDDGAVGVPVDHDLQAEGSNLSGRDFERGPVGVAEAAITGIAHNSSMSGLSAADSDSHADVRATRTSSDLASENPFGIDMLPPVRRALHCRSVHFDPQQQVCSTAESAGPAALTSTGVAEAVSSGNAHNVSLSGLSAPDSDSNVEFRAVTGRRSSQTVTEDPVSVDVLPHVRTWQRRSVQFDPQKRISSILAEDRPVSAFSSGCQFKSQDGEGQSGAGTDAPVTSMTGVSQASSTKNPPRSRPSSNRTMVPPSWSMLQGAWFFYVVILVLAVTNSSVSIQLRKLGPRMQAVSLISYLALTVEQVRAATMALVHVHTFARQNEMRNFLISRTDYMRIVVAFLRNGHVDDTMIPQDLLDSHANAALFLQSMRSGGLGADKGPDPLLMGPPNGCWRSDKSKCLMKNDTLYEYSILTPVEMIYQLRTEALLVVDSMDTAWRAQAARVGMDPPPIVNGSLPTSYFLELDGLSTSKEDIAAYDLVTANTELTIAYRYVDEIVKYDLGNALEAVLQKRIHNILGVCTMAHTTHTCAMALILLLLFYYLRLSVLQMAKQARTETLRVAEVLSLLPAHAKVVNIVQDLLSDEKGRSKASHAKRHRRHRPPSLRKSASTKVAPSPDAAGKQVDDDSDE